MQYEEIMRSILSGFVMDPPDDDFQRGYLSAMVTFANEVIGIPYHDPLWLQANYLLNGDDPRYALAAAKMKEKRPALTLIDGGQK